MRARAAIVGTILTLLGGSICAAQVAQAATSPKPPPSVVVASDEATRLLVHDDDGQLCLAIRTPGGQSESCEDSEGGVVVVGGSASDALYAGVATAATASIVELRRAGQLLASAPTVAGEAYKGGRAGKVRFALLRLPAMAPSDGLRVRALDVHGALVEAIAPDSEGELVFDRHRLLSGVYGRVRWSIEGSQSSALTPSILGLEHESISRCATVRTRHGGSSSSSSTCVGSAPRDSLTLLGDASVATEDGCTPQFRLLHGIVDASVQRVTFLLGDGRRRVARTAPLGDGTRLVYGLAIPHEAAVRSVTFDRGAAGSNSRRLAIAPLAIDCATGSDDGFVGYGPALDVSGSVFDHLPPVTPVGPVTTVPGPPPFRIADGPGESLCIALGDVPFTALGCAIVSPAFDELVGAFDSFVSPRSFAIAVPARVAAVRVATSDGKISRTIATVPGTGYAGAYAGRVRFASATVGSVGELSNLDLLDAQGAILHSEHDSAQDPDAPAPRIVARRRVAGRAGHPSLWQTTFRGAKTRSDCLALTAGPRPPRARICQAERSSATVLLDASCVSHRLTVAVAATAGTRVRAGARTIRLHRGAGLVTLPAKRPLPSLTFVRKGRTSTVRVGAPPGARQCGWSAAPAISLRSSNSG